MRHVIALEVRAQHQDEVLLAGALVAHRIEVRRDPVADQAMVPRHEFAGGVEAGFEAVRRQRPEAPVADVVLARPHHLHRPARLLREQHRVNQEVHVARPAPAESSAQ